MLSSSAVLANIEFEKTVDDKVRALFPENISSSTLRLIQSSTNLSDWEPIARNFGYDWQNVFPNTVTLDEAIDGRKYHEVDFSSLSSFDGTVFYRISSNATQTVNNTNSVSRFLMQATFGPTLNSIHNFPGLNATDLNDAPFTYYNNWITSQMALPISSHRAFFRERSNPDYVNNTNSVGEGEISLFEVGNNSNYGMAFDYVETYNDFQPHAGSSTFTSNGVDYTTGGTSTLDGDTYTFRKYTNGNYIQNIEVSRYQDWIDNGQLTSNPNDANPVNRQEQKSIIWNTIAIDGDDQLRQRMAWALSQIFVVGLEGSIHPQNTEKWLKYYDIFVRHAFGNFIHILREITYSPHMGYYLTFENNKKQDGDKFPDENYAREIMQLFTIGLWELNQDGTYKTDVDGNLIPTYSNENIENFARVFTGLRRQENPTSQNHNFEAQFGPDYQTSYRINRSWHDFGVKTNLYEQAFQHKSQNLNNNGNGTEQDVRDDIEYVLQHLFDHDNTPPFISKLLIQRLTSSNPSPTYINDVAQAFIDGQYAGIGSGQRGDLGATLRAILLHPEARVESLSLDQTYGKFREPYIRFINYCRAFNLTSYNTYGLYNIRSLAEKLGQSPYNYPSVFNFYVSDYQPLGAIIDKNLVSPEMQILTDVTSVQLPNCLWWLIYEGIKRNDTDTGIGYRWYSQGDLDLSDQIALANDSDALIEQLDTLITAGRLSEQNRIIIKNHIDSLPSGSTAQKEKRVQDALYLFCMIPEFNTLY